MTILHALDITVNDKPAASHNTSRELDPKNSNLTIESHQIGQGTATTMENSNNLAGQVTLEGETTEENLWHRANSMMGDLEGLGMQLKIEVESTMKQVVAKQQNESHRIANLSRSLEDYQTEINSLKLNISALQAVADENQEEHKLNLQQCESKHREIEREFQGKILSLESQVEDLKNQNNELKIELQTTKESLESRNSTDSGAVEQLNYELKNKDSQIKLLQVEIDSINKTINDQNSKINNLEDDKAKLSSALLEKDSDISDLNEKLQQTEEEYGGHIILLEKQLTESKTSLEQETKDREYYMKQLEVAIAQHESLQEKYKAKKKENKDLELAVEQAKKTTGMAISQSQLKYYQEMERKYVQAKK